MYYVYLLRSLEFPDRTYVGYTTDLKQRFETHNTGGSVYTAHLGKWELVAYIAFENKTKALAFEKYLKIGSGHAFARRHFW